MRIAGALLLLPCLLGVTCAGGAAAQPALDAQLVKAPSGGLAGFSTPSPELARHGQVTWGAHFDHARRPLRLRCLQAGSCPQGGTEQIALQQLSDLQLSVSAGLLGWVELGLSFGAAHTRGAHNSAELSEPASGIVATDMRFDARGALLRGPLWLSLWAQLGAPTGNQVRYAGEDGFSLLSALLAGYRMGPVQVAAVSGIFLRRATRFGGLSLGDELRLSASVDYTLSSDAGVFVESLVRVPVGAAEPVDAQKTVESALGLRFDLRPGLRVRVGAGTGAWPAQGYGASDYRILLDLRARSGGCPYGPEDYDGYRDDDQCADPDNDGDGLPDAEDSCPDAAEDVDGFADADGCPDPDDDADGLPDATDGCPTRSEDRDGYQDDDGCPDVDNDGDGVGDGVDDCPGQPEDRDGFEDGDGCPEPGPERLTVTVTDTRILVSDRVYFESGADVLRSVSLPVLDEVARAILSLPADRHVSIEGHTDEVGSAEQNLDLSFRRARAVLEYLVSRGVPEERLSHVGYGATRPLVEARSPEARAMNRRVEFRISTAEAGSDLEKPAKLTE